MRRVWWIAAGALLLDQLTKTWVRAAFLPDESRPVVAAVFHLTYVQNTGAAFGMFQGHTGLFILCSLAVIAWIAWEFWRERGRPLAATGVGLSLILGGAVGNLIDRVRLGHVTDFLDFRVWPVFNVADTCISVGVGLCLLASLRKKVPDTFSDDAS